VQRSVEALRKAAALVPAVIVFQYELAEGLSALGQRDGAVAVLERALAASERQDVEYVMRARLLLGELYSARGWTALATVQYRAVAAGSSRPVQVEHATAVLARLGQH